MHSKEVINGNDTAMSAMVKMAEGNPGAITAIMKLMEDNAKIDPQSILGSIGVLLDLDTLGIHGSRIWQLYKDVCGHDSVKVITLLRAYQLGLMPERNIHAAIEGDYKPDFTVLLSSVKSQLTEFARDQ